MTFDEYSEKIKLLSGLLRFPIGEFFDLEFSPHAEEYLDVITFYDTTLQNYALYGIVPAFIYFNNYTSRNAKAGILNGNYLISMNKGLIFWLIKSFKDEPRIDEIDIPLFNRLRPHLDVPISKLMYQMSVHFTFYHEMAHLIQQSDIIGLNLEEIPIENAEYDETKHLLELDADEFSSLCLGSHALQYLQKLFGEGGKPVLEALLIILNVPIILYVLSFYTNGKDFYLREMSHPHPAIRLMLITLTIVHYCNQSLSIKKREFQIDYKFVIQQALEMAQYMETEFMSTKRVETLIKVLRENLEDILKYVDYFNGLKEGNESLAVYKWNQVAVNKDEEE